MNELEIFKNEEFGEVRTLTDNGRTLFCASDIAKALGYAIPTKAVNAHCKGVSKMEVPTRGGIQTMLFIPEGDIYRLIVRSKLPSAEKFEKWVFDEVLPTIRKTGSYAMLPDFNNPVEAARAWANEVEAKQLALKEKEKLNKQLIEAKPKLTYYDTILNSKGTMNITQIASDYGLSAIKCNKLLHEAHLIYKSGGQWVLYDKYKGLGYVESRTFDFVNSDGIVISKTHTYWTQKGRLKIHEILTGMGYIANFDKTQMITKGA